MAEEEHPDSNRNKKLEGRDKRRKHVQGTRAFTHAMTNRKAKQAARHQTTADRDGTP